MGTLDWLADNAWNIINSAAIVGTLYVATKALRVQKAAQLHAVEQTTPKLQLRAFTGVFVNEEPWVREAGPTDTAHNNALMLVLSVSNPGAVPVRLHSVGFCLRDGTDSPLSRPMTPGHKPLPIELKSDERVPITIEHKPRASSTAVDIWVESGSGQRWLLGRREFARAVRHWSETYARVDRET